VNFIQLPTLEVGILTSYAASESHRKLDVSTPDLFYESRYKLTVLQ